MLDNILVNLFNGLITVYIVCLFYSAFAPKYEFKGRGWVLLGLTVLFWGSLMLQLDKAINFVVLLSVVIGLAFLYQTKWYNRIFLGVAFVLLSSFAELVVAMSSSYILGVELDVLKTGMYFVVGILLSKLFSFIIVAILRVGRHTMPITRLGGTWLYISLLPIASVVTIFIISDYIYLIQDQPMMQTVTLVGMCLLIAANILIFYVIDRICDQLTARQNLAVANELLESQRAAYRALCDSQDEVHKTRHDLKNSMIGVLHLLQNGQVEAAQAYIRERCDLLDADKRNLLCYNDIVDAVLYAKKQMADSHGVTMHINVELTNPIQMDAIDFAVLLGNALDNAIEAAERMGKGNREVSLSIITKGDTIVMIIRNPVEEKLDVNYLMTTKTDTKCHGFGLLQMQQLTQKYGGDLLLDCSGEEFKTTIILGNNTNEQAD